MAAADHVPQELIEDILSRVPAKSLLRFKTASKNWYSLFSQDHKFAEFHLKKSRNHPLRFFQVSPLGGTIFRSLDPDTNASCNFSFPVEIGCEIELIGSANGLICVSPWRQGDYCFIWNPCTGECKKISVPIPRASLRVSGFGYDSSSDDYKIVADWDGSFRFFSLKTNSWKIFDYCFPVKSKAFHFDGALHWCVDRNIAVFDLAKEVFSYIELPDELKELTSLWFVRRCVSLWDYQGLLCLSGGKASWGGESIWALKKYGDPKSWVKLSTLLEHRSPVGISKLGQVVYQAKGGSGFVKSDIHIRMSKDDKSRIYDLSQSPLIYTESLISPTCFDSESTRPRKRRKTAAT